MRRVKGIGKRIETYAGEKQSNRWIPRGNSFTGKQRSRHRRLHKHVETCHEMQAVTRPTEQPNLIRFTKNIFWGSSAKHE